MKKITTLGIALFFTTACYAQDQDSLNFVKSVWQKKKVAPKTKLVTRHFDNKSLFDANEYISYLEVKNTGRKVELAVGADEKTLITTSQFGKINGATAALNGTFFDIKNGGSVDYTRVNGKVINTTRLEKGGKRARHQEAAIVINNGVLKIEKWDGTPNWEDKIAGKDVMLSGPLLSYENITMPLDTSSFTKLRHPRTSIGIKPNGNVLLLTVDGRQDNSAGMSLLELTKIMRWLGCTTSINLDGGGSTTLWLEGYGENGVVNFPSDNKKWDHEGQRKVANVVLLKRK